MNEITKTGFRTRLHRKFFFFFVKPKNPFWRKYSNKTHVVVAFPFDWLIFPFPPRTATLLVSGRFRRVRTEPIFIRSKTGTWRSSGRNSATAGSTPQHPWAGVLECRFVLCDCPGPHPIPDESSYCRLSLISFIFFLFLESTLVHCSALHR